MKNLVSVMTAVIIGVVLFLSQGAEDRRPVIAQEGGRTQELWYRVVFGLDGQDAAWDGRVTVTNGELLDIDPWSFEARDQLDADGASWKVRTGTITGRRVTYAEPTRGVLVKVTSRNGTTLALKTKQGDAQADLGSLRAGRLQQLLGGRASIEVLGTESLVAKSLTDDDFPAIALASNGHRFVMWQAYDDAAKRDRLLVRNVDDPNSQPESVFDAKEFAWPHLFVTKGDDGKETLRAVFCSPGPHKDWDVYSAVKTSRGWKPQRLTSAEGSDLFLSASQADDGTIWISWQSLRDGDGDIYVKRLTRSEWSPEILMTEEFESQPDQWESSIAAVDPDHAWIAYDSYENGNYDVELRSVSISKGDFDVSDVVDVAASTDFEAHPSVLVDGDDVWVTYDAAGPNWGKDFKSSNTIKDGVYAEPLHAQRRIELRLVRDGKVHSIKQPIPQQLPPDRIHQIERSATAKPSRFYEYPQLAQDGDGRLWLMFRMCRQGYCAHPPMGIDWRIYATAFTESGWLEPIELPRSQGRQNQRVAFDTGPDGRLAFAWSEGNRFASINRKFSVRHGRLPEIDEPAGTLDVVAYEPDEPGRPTPEPEVELTMEKGGRAYRVFFGDLHRHTNISRCMPTIDGSLEDAHRYALNAVEYDFLAVTDHTRDVDPFSWWRTQKAVDWFSIPGRYAPIYAYERSNYTATGGHRNVFFLNRGAEVNPGDHWVDGVGRKKPDSDVETTLYPWLKERGDALTAAHTPGFEKSKGTGTWTWNDPQVEPVAEIFQGFRKSYERPGGSVAEEASLWHALRKGYRLGFIASSDHMSTHMSFACVWAVENTRESIFEGLSARRTYAATDRIGLAMSIGDALMGEETKLNGDEVTLRIRAEGTATIKEVQIVRSGKVIETLQPGTQDLDTAFSDPDPLDGQSFYYVRLIQTDGEIAWGSPIWISR